MSSRFGCQDSVCIMLENALWVALIVLFILVVFTFIVGLILKNKKIHNIQDTQEESE